MKPAIQRKLQGLADRLETIKHLLSQPEVISDQNRFRELSKEYAQLGPTVDCFSEYQKTIETIGTTQTLLEDSDVDMRTMAADEFKNAKEKQELLEQQLRVLLLPQDPNDNRNVFLEIRGAAGGDESAIFAGDLARMYSRYAESQGWQVEVLNSSAGEHGGYKNITLRLIGQGAYSQLKFESGAHRVQRVPETEAQGRIHTSTCTVAVLPEIEEIEDININPTDLKIETFRASGAGGQHVQKTDSAIRITHLPTGTVVECQDERSQHKNRARAMSLLHSRILAAEQEKQRSEQAQKRRILVGTGDRSERIRTYNFPQGRLTDHRINLTVYSLLKVMEGDLNPILHPLIQEYQADLLAEENE